MTTKIQQAAEEINNRSQRLSVIRVEEAVKILTKHFYELEKESDDLTCPWCKENNFDNVGLKIHIANGNCEVFESLNVALPRTISHTAIDAAISEQSKGLAKNPD